MKRLILIRHGETEWNSDRRIQGSVDVPLSEKGVAQAEALAETLAGEGETFDRVYTSDLQRSSHTGKILAERLGVEAVTASPLLRELHCGAWEGRAIDDLRTGESEAYERWLLDPDFVIPGGESVTQLHGRVRRFFTEERPNLDASRAVLIVAHGLLNRMVLSVLLKLDPQHSRYFSQDNTAMNVFTWHGPRCYCEAWNLTCHL